MNERTTIQVLVVAGERPLKLLLEQPLPGEGPLAVAVEAGEAARELAERQRFDVTQLDFELPSVGRIETRRRHDDNGDAGIVIVDRQRLKDAVESEPEPAARPHFLTRPVTADELRKVADEARERQRRRADDEGASETREVDPDAPYFGTSRPMVELLEKVRRVAQGSASVMLQGETGTGKGLVARLIQSESPRSKRPFITINCSAFQEQLLESELFGHEKGAFTGAVAAKPGLFEVADGGTLFLDEIAETSPAMQAKLLQVLDEGELRRVGGTRGRRVDVRIIAASNKELPQEVRAGRFREDLLFRLNVISLRVPPLRERQRDIPGLAELFLERFRLPGEPRKQLSAEALQLLKAYAWPGNVRELANTLEGLTLLAPEEVIRAKDLPPNLRPASRFELHDDSTPLPLSEIERLHVARTLRYTEGKKAPAARLLGIDVKTLNNKIRTYAIEV